MASEVLAAVYGIPRTEYATSPQTVYNASVFLSFPVNFVKENLIDFIVQTFTCFFVKLSNIN